MGGLEEILKQINAEADAEIAEIMSQTETQCEELRTKSQEQIRKLVSSMDRQSKEAAALALKKMKSGAEVKKKQDILRLKQRIITEMIEKAHQEIADMEPEKYFDFLLQVAKKNAHKESGIIKLNERDLRRMPDDFRLKIEKEGLALTIGEVPADIADGMILSYGDIEENCTIQALINAEKEQLQDKINNYIFG